MNRKRLLLASSAFALLVGAGVAWAGDLSDASLNKLLDLSGINRQTATIQETIKTSFRQTEQNSELSGKKWPLTKQKFTEVEGAVIDAFKPETLIQSYSARIKADVSEADAQEMLAWLESDLGRRIAQAEVDATTDEAHGNMMNDARTLLADEERVAIARRMSEVLQNTDTAIHFQVEVSVAMYVAFSRKLHPDRPVDVEAFRKLAAARVDRAHIEQNLILMSVYTYRNIDIPSLKKYLAFLEQPATHRYHEALWAGMMEGLNKCTAKATADASTVAKKP